MRKSAPFSRFGGLSLVSLVAATMVAGSSLVLLSVNSVPAAARVTVDPYRTALHQLRICNLGPEEFAAAGVNAAGLIAVANKGGDYITKHGELAGLLEASHATNARYEALRRKVESGTAKEHEKTALDTAIAVKTAAARALASAKSAFVSAALADVAEGVRQKLNTLAANNGLHVPVEFKLEPRDEAQWLGLRNACAAERIALKRQRPVPIEAASLLADARATGSAASAKTALDANIVANRLVFDPARNR